MRCKRADSTPCSPTNDVLTSESGIVVLLMGQTGAGKGHFINTAAGRQIAPEYKELEPPLSEIQAFVVHAPKGVDRRALRASSVVLVDTPGLNNGKRLSDATILKRVNAWLDENCSQDVRIGGIIFLQDVTVDRASEYNAHSTWPVNCLSSPKLVQRLLLVTGKWDIDQGRHHEYQRTEELLKKTKEWSMMLSRGARLRRFEGNADSAWTALNQVLEMDPQPISLLQNNVFKIGNELNRERKPGFFRKLKGLFSRIR
ncbi:hypothetical protein D9611_000783 [Ephemerocybe angulata]|uniref:AIG1-type G domain-containing protein n=1 Tax=Ephemerocybe angulata TaxID=980116 RepID=A0A8H5BMK9_9AGAR|nr:hypothetical protein D9611_000783 [Tulosesus angulatus]